MKFTKLTRRHLGATDRVAWKAAERKAMVKAADKAFSAYIVARDVGKCVGCGSEKRVQCGHLFTRAAYATRWDPANAAAQCSGCNLRHEYDPEPFRRYFVARYGAAAVDELWMTHKRTVKLTAAQIEEIARYFTLKAAVAKAEELEGK